MPDVLNNAGGVLAGPPAPPSQTPPPDPNAAPAPQQIDPATAANIAHSASFGQAVKNLLGSLHGQQTVYRANPQTGQVEATTVPTRPGKFFRDLLAGALIGGAASGGGEGGFVGGFARGGTAAMQDQQQQDQQAYERARQAQSDSLEKQKADDEHTLHMATIAHLNLQMAAAQHELHNLDQQQLDKKNASAKAYEDSIKNTDGAQPVKFSVGGQNIDSMTAPEFQTAFVKDPSILHASSDDYVRHFVDVNDATELHNAGPGRWVDDAGNNIRLADNTTIRAYDIPTRTLKTPQQVPGSTLLKIRPSLEGSIDPNHSYSVAPEALSALYTAELKDNAEAARTAAEKSLADQRATKGARDAANNAKTIADIESKRATAFERANRDYQKALSVGSDPEAAKATLDQARQDAQTGYDNAMNALKGQRSSTSQHRPTGGTNPKNNPPTPPYKVGDTVTLKNGQSVQITKINPNGTFEYR
jgi:hypothetical protein